MDAGLPKQESVMQCVLCKIGHTSRGESTVTLTRGATTVVIKGVPADVCGNCGEPYLDEDTSAWVMDRAEQAAAQGVGVEIVRYAA